ncbi:MAG: ferrous iron transport protein B, partial [Treponema sp.]|nr:ferrous iron transport protein B [Treponema sp.]
MTAVNNNIKIALAGNPNSGKTTLFNALTGAHRKVGNYPGVTVEKLEGVVQRGSRRYHFTDLPGIYSLTAYSVDEVVARDFILNEKPDVIVDVMDSTNLERNLYLCLQFQELRIPVVGALNMTDEAEAKGVRIDEQVLSASLGIPMVKTVGHKGIGTENLLDRVDEIIDGKIKNGVHMVHYGSEIEDKLEALQKLIGRDAAFVEKYPPRWLAVKLLEKDAAAFERLEAHKDVLKITAAAKDAAVWIGEHFGRDAEIVVSEQRYGYIRGATRESVKIVKQADYSITERIDRVIMNGYLALPIFILVMWGIFQATFAIGEYPMAWLEAGLGALSETLTNALPDNLFRSLLVDGVIGGVGGVLSFVPLIVILFFFLSILEDVGYMARAAFATDKFLHSIGLHGQSIFPMLLGFGCSVPAMMAARTLKNPRDRILTVLITPFMSCGAKLPVHVLLAASLFATNQANMVILMYTIGVVLSLIAAFVLRRTVLKGDPTPFVMELPPYRAPTLRGILWHVWEKTWFYIKKAGTIILAISIVVWIITTFPRYEASDAERADFAAAFYAENPDAGDEAEEAVSQYVETAEVQRALEKSFAGRLGHFIEPVFRPLGFDWKLSTASITGFAAKEVIVSTLGVLYRVGAEEDEESEGLRESIARDPNMTPLVAFVFMLFVLIIPPCIAALGTMKAEIGGKWLAFEVTFQLLLGWTLCAVVYQIGS